jgi:IS605 OrfB family transposase
VTDLRAACLGVDLNADHIAAVVCDHMGNPVARARFAFPVAGTPEGVAQAMVGDAVAGLVKLALHWRAGISAEKLDFARKKAALKVYGKAHARRLSGWACARFQAMLESACARSGVDLHPVDPAFTSVIGGLKYARGRAMSRHHTAALVIARRAQGFGERFVCMAHTPLRGPGRNQRRHRWTRWRDARPMAGAEGNGAVRPRRSGVGSGSGGRPPPAPDMAARDKAGPTSRTRCRDAERTARSPQPAWDAVVRARSGGNA